VLADAGGGQSVVSHLMSCPLQNPVTMRWELVGCIARFATSRRDANARKATLRTLAALRQ